jgi:predicted nuclease of predicted toxin-antitoxin system
VKILLDMNLSPDWVPALEAEGHESRHWSTVGAFNAPDTEIMAWARNAGHVVLTQDLDYGALLFATQATAPSVVVLRAEDVRPRRSCKRARS